MKTNYFLPFVLFTILLTFTAFKSDAKPPKADKFIIMIDPGHGGRDTGTPGTKRYRTTEKDIALDVSLALGKMITDNMPHVEVLYTRTKDVFPSLNDRANKANTDKADLFISIHCNAQPKGGSAYGSETYVLGTTKNQQNLEVAKRENSVIFLEDNYEENYKDFDPNSPESMIGLILSQEEYLEQSIQLANYIETEFQVSANRKSRGVKQNVFYVLAYTYMPSVLVELGFLTNKKEEDFLNSKKGKNIMTKSLYNAVKKYVDARVKNDTQDIAILVDQPYVEKPSAETRIIEGVTFKVQIAASSKQLETKPYNFKGLKDISREKNGRIYKYFYGQTSDYNVINTYKNEAKEKGYKSAFIVAYKDGKKVSLAQALKSKAN